MSTKRKISGYGEQATIALKNIVDRYEKYSMSAAKGAIRLQPYKTGDDAHCVKVATATSHVAIPQTLMQISGLKPGDEVMLFADDKTIIIYTDTFSGDMSEFHTGDAAKFAFTKESALTSRTTVIHKDMSKGNTVSIKAFAEKAGLEHGGVAVCSYFHVGTRCWLEVRAPRKGDDKLSSAKHLGKMKNSLNKAALSGLTYQTKLIGYTVRLSSIFRAELRGLPIPPSMPIWFDEKRKVIIIEAPEKICAVCGDTISSIAEHKVTAVCPHCMKKLGQGNDIHKMSEAMSVIHAADVLS